MHNILSISLVRVPGVYLTSLRFPGTLFPMGLATAVGSLLSVAICLVAFALCSARPDDRQRRNKKERTRLFPVGCVFYIYKRMLV